MRSCREWKDGKRSTMRRMSGISVSTASIRRSWCKGGSELTSSISGMCLRRTRRIRFLKPSARLIPLPMPDLRMRAAWAYFASWPQLATEFAPLSKTKLTMPVLSIGGEKSLGNQLGAQMKLVADNVTIIVLQNAGHWILEEKPKETTAALLNFL